jgi:hypothetical protein
VKVDEDLYTLVERFPKNDPAWYLLDAFDAVTNGMENPEAMEKTALLKNLELEPWKLAVKAIQSLYSGECEQCRFAAEQIPDGSAPARLKPLFRAWLGRGKTRGRKQPAKELAGSSEKITALFEKLLVEPHPLSLVAEQAEEALRQGLAGQFSVFAGKALCGLREYSESAALRYCAYCLDLLRGAGYGGEDFFPLAVKILGEAEAFYAQGFALAGGDPAGAAAALERARQAAARDRLPPLLFLGGEAAIGELLRFLKPAKTKRRPKNPRQPDLFCLPDTEPEESGDSREAIRAFLRKTPGAEQLAEIIRMPASFEELTPCLPPAARYLGPGAWIQAIQGPGGTRP